MVARININGTSPEVLIEQLMNLIEALRSVESALKTAMPHPRDYQTYDNDFEYRRDRKKWVNQCAQIRAMIEDTEKTILALQEQKDATL